MEHVQEISNSDGKSVVTFTLTLPSQVNPAELISLLRQARSEKRKLGHDAAADAIGDLLSLARPEFYYQPARGSVQMFSAPRTAISNILTAHSYHSAPTCHFLFLNAPSPKGSAPGRARLACPS